MKKTFWTALLGGMLALTLCMPAMAQTTGIQVDGKTYTFTGGEGTYQADGKTFIIGADSVTVQEAGKPELVLSLSHTPDTQVVQDGFAVFIEQSQDSADNVAISAAEDMAAPIAAYVQSSVAAEAGSAVDTQEVVTEYAQSTCAAEDIDGVDPERFAPYAAFGLGYDAASDALTYQGQRVRIFEDAYPVEAQAYAVFEHVDAKGTIDVKAVRDLSERVYNADGSYDPSGALTGLYVLSSEEFAARDLRNWIAPSPVQSTAVEGVEITPAEKQALYAPYAAFGLSYDMSSDTLAYQGRRVRWFTDIRQSNGEPLDSGRFQGVMTCIGDDVGEVDVETIRDFTKPGADGDGALIGLKVKEIR